MSSESDDRARRFPAGQTAEPRPGRRFGPDEDAVADALEVVRALDADSYQVLLWALGLTPDPRLSVPGYGGRLQTAGERDRAD
ncbi:MAG: hypothetical protein ACR2KV_04660 [Solirubrobacteraceae bacterium]